MERDRTVSTDANFGKGPISPRLSLDSSRHNVKPVKQTNPILIDQILHILRETDLSIKRKIEAIENIGLTGQIISFKIFEATHQFRNAINEAKEERNQVLLSIKNTSELSLILHDLDKKISDLEKEFDGKLKHYNTEKLEFQHQEENLVADLDDDLGIMQEMMKNFKEELEVKLSTVHRAQAMLIDKKYGPQVNELQEDLLGYEKLHMTSWKVVNSEEKLSEILEEQGLKCTPSGKLLTNTGDFLTFEEAQDKGYFKNVHASLDKLIQFFKEQDQQKQAFVQISGPQPASSEASSVQSKITSEDVKYLKQVVGKPLTLALAEITATQPKDPIHYLGHYLFKYRYNQELEETQKREVEELTEQREILARERWKKFVEEEARHAVLEMILRAEQIGYQNELKRYEQARLAAEEEEEENEGEEQNQDVAELLEEARDKFE